ncbi:MAG: hypothetical protein R6X09_07630 [Bacteroidales bacterium]
MLTFLFVSVLSLHAQRELGIRSLIRDKDVRKLIKADDYKADADQLVEEATRLNMDVLLMQADPNLDEKTKAKKAGRIEGQAQQKQIQASSLYEKCNEIKFAVYKQYIDEFWETHEGEETDYLNAKLLEEQSSDHFFQAVSYRIEARKMDDIYMRLDKLSEANNLENEALKKQITALTAYYLKGEVPAVEANPVTATKVLSDFADSSSAETDDLLARTDTLAEETRDYSIETETLPFDPAGTNIILMQDAGFPSGDKALTVEPLAGHYLASGFLFRIQVASSRIPLSLGQLKEAYPGDYPVELIREDDGYNYQLMGVRLYSDAVQLLKKVNTSGAFIVAYDNGVKVSLAEAVEDTEELEKNVRTYGRKGQIQETEYHLQIAASRRPMPSHELDSLYAGPEPVVVIYEDGWYKYHLKAGNSFDTAKKLRQSCLVDQAFIVSYKNATRVIVK